MSSEQPRILLVDDNELNLFLLMDMLQELDVVPIIAESGNEALKFASRHKFALILLDVEMPGMDGYQVLNQLAGNPDTEEVPVIFMSPNLADLEAKSHSTLLAPVDSIHKPINKTLLVDKVSTYLKLDNKYQFLSQYYQDKIRTDNKSPEGMLALNNDGTIVYANPTAVAMLRSSLPQLIGLYFETLLERSHHEVVSNWQNSVLYQACKNEKTTKVEHTLFWCGDGHKLVVSFVAYPLAEGARSISNVDTLIVFNEIQNQAYSDEKLSALVNFDPLTRLINKESFEEITHVAIDSMNPGEPLALMLWNLDHYDYINESLGHEIGDQLLKAIAQRLGNCLPSSSTLARIGGDDFALLIPALANPRVAITTAHALLTVFKASFLVGGHEIFVSASAGIATCPESGTNVSKLMRNADRALKKAKDGGRARVEMYNSAMALANVASFEMATELHHVLHKQQLYLSYKPVINLLSTKLSGVEALAYWRHPEYGVLGLDEFQEVAEEAGLMPDIGEWILAEACRNWQSWDIPAGAEGFRLRVKLSLFHLLFKGFEKSLDTILSVTKFDPACLELEISEANLNRDNLAAFVTIFKVLNDKGIRIILDDFGSNYLTLATLEDVEFHGVKLGGEFLRSTMATPRCDVVLKSVIDIAHEYGAEVTAAEVARGDQIALLRKLGCDTGSLFEKEFGADEVQKELFSDGF
ncbi:MAG: EAL domain-containing protein [Pseudomonadales bacterium]|nr:EAL domain-containing protein [Pseudomonadales bacterium]